MKLYEISGDWVAAKNKRSAIKCFEATTNITFEEAGGECVVCPEKDWEHKKFRDGDPYDESCETITFRQRVANLLAEGENLPLFVATSNH